MFERQAAQGIFPNAEALERWRTWLALDGRRYPWGDAWDPLRANVYDTHLKQPAPVGVSAAGDSPFGVADMSGNVAEWTSSLYGTRAYGVAEAEYGYPYQADDGREDATAGTAVRRVCRGGSFIDRLFVQCAFRNMELPGGLGMYRGFRVAAAVAAA